MISSPVGRAVSILVARWRPSSNWNVSKRSSSRLLTRPYSTNSVEPYKNCITGLLWRHVPTNGYMGMEKSCSFVQWTALTGYWSLQTPCTYRNCLSEIGMMHWRKSGALTGLATCAWNAPEWWSWLLYSRTNEGRIQDPSIDHRCVWRL